MGLGEGGAREGEDGAGAAKPVGRGEGLRQAACTVRMDKKAEATRVAPVTAVPIRKGFLRFDIGGDLVIRVGYVGIGILWARHGRQRSNTGRAWRRQGRGRGVDRGHVDGSRSFRLSVLL